MEQRFMERVASKFKIFPNHTRMGLVHYSNYSIEFFGLQDYKNYETLSAAIEAMQRVVGRGSTTEALYLAYTMLTSCHFGSRPDTGVEQTIVLMTG